MMSPPPLLYAPLLYAPHMCTPPVHDEVDPQQLQDIQGLAAPDDGADESSDQGVVFRGGGSTLDDERVLQTDADKFMCTDVY